MDGSELDEALKNYSAIIQDVCKEYGLYGSAVYYAPCLMPDSDKNRMYIIGGPSPDILKHPMPSYFKPDEILRRNERNNKLFYPDAWVYDLSEGSDTVHIMEELVEYCRKAEFLLSLYGKYGLPLPGKIRVSELSQLVDFYQATEDLMLPASARNDCKRQLDRFFKREKAAGFRKKWLDYFRSEKWPDGGGFFSKIQGYLKRNNNLTSMEALMNVNPEIHKLQMQEHEYKLFSEYMYKFHPDVTYYAGEKDIVDHGIGSRSMKEDSKGIRLVTGEELAVIQKERFAKEGFAALANLKPAYWEFRDIHYKAVDEPLIAAAYKRITLAYADSESLAELKERGDICLKQVPTSDFMNFVSLAKANNLHFYLDNRGEYASASLESVNVIYNDYQADKMEGILSRMINDKVQYSHMIEKENRPSLNSVIKTIELSPPEKLSAHSNEPSKVR